MVAKTKRLSKVCKRCGKRKLLKYFGKQATTKDGLGVYCERCVKAYNQEYYQVHRIKLLGRATKRYNDNKGKQDG